MSPSSSSSSSSSSSLPLTADPTLTCALRYDAKGLIHIVEACRFSSCVKQLDLSDNNILGEGEGTRGGCRLQPDASATPPPPFAPPPPPPHPPPLPHPTYHPSGESKPDKGPTANGSTSRPNSTRGGDHDPNPNVVDKAYEQAKGRGRPLIQNMMRDGGFQLHTKLDKGKRVYLVLVSRGRWWWVKKRWHVTDSWSKLTPQRRNMADRNAGGFESF